MPAAYGLRVLTTAGALVLDVATTGGYYIRTMQMPVQTRRRDVVSSPDMPGEFERQSVLDAAILEVVVSVRGSDDSTAWTRYDSLYAALCGSTRRFRVETTFRGQTDTWDATRAQTWRLNSDPRLMRNHHYEVSIQVPVYPIPS